MEKKIQVFDLFRFSAPEWNAIVFWKLSKFVSGEFHVAESKK